MRLRVKLSKPAMIGTVMRLRVGSSTAFSRDKYETIDAQAFGTVRPGPIARRSPSILLNDKDKSKNTGTLYPAAQLVLNKEGKLQWDLNQNAWRLSDLIDWKGTVGLN